MKVGDETAEIEFEDLDKPVELPELKSEAKEEEDPLKEIEGKMGETLVLNM